MTPGVAYCGAFYGQTNDGEPLAETLSVDALARVLGTLPPGVTELCCHPAETIDFETTYADARLRELDTLCAPGLRTVLEDEGIELRSFRDLA